MKNGLKKVESSRYTRFNDVVSRLDVVLTPFMDRSEQFDFSRDKPLIPENLTHVTISRHFAHFLQLEEDEDT